MGIPALKQPKVLIKPSANGYDSKHPDGGGTDPAPEPGDIAITGEIINGAPLTITSELSIFGTKEQQSTPVYDQFNYTSGALLRDENPLWVPYSANDGALVTTDLSRTGGLSVMNTSDRGQFDTNHIAYPSAKEAFVSYWMYFDAETFGVDEAVGKPCRLTWSTAGGGGGVYNGKGTLRLNNMNPKNGGGAAIAVDKGTEAVTLGYINIPYKQWARVNMYGRHSTIDSSNGRVWVQAVGSGNKNYENISTAASGEECFFDTLILGLMMANVLGDGMRMFIDEVYVDRGENALSRIELCESTTWSDDSYKEIQPYTSWQGGQVTISQNHGNMSGECGLFFVPASGNPILLASINIGD